MNTLLLQLVFLAVFILSNWKTVLGQRRRSVRCPVFFERCRFTPYPWHKKKRALNDDLHVRNGLAWKNGHMNKRSKHVEQNDFGETNHFDRTRERNWFLKTHAVLDNDCLTRFVCLARSMAPLDADADADANADADIERTVRAVFRPWADRDPGARGPQRLTQLEGAAWTGAAFGPTFCATLFDKCDRTYDDMAESLEEVLKQQHIFAGNELK